MTDISDEKEQTIEDLQRGYARATGAATMSVVTAEVFHSLPEEERQAEVRRFYKLPPRLQKMDFAERVGVACAALTDVEKATLTVWSKQATKQSKRAGKL